MAGTAAHLADRVLPRVPVRQWVLSVPHPLRLLLASRLEVVGRVLGIIHRGITTHLTKKAGFSRRTTPTGAVTLIQRFGTALSLKVHFQVLLLDGVVCRASGGFTALLLGDGAEGW